MHGPNPRIRNNHEQEIIRLGVFPSANEDAVAAQRHMNSPQCTSDSYLLAFQDQNFLLREKLHPVHHIVFCISRPFFPTYFYNNELLRLATREV